MKKLLLLLIFPLLSLGQNLKTIYASQNDVGVFVDWKELLKSSEEEISTPPFFSQSESPLNYSASSFLMSQGSNSYGPKNMFDKNPFTAWVEGVSGYGIGETITIEGPAPNYILNGYQKSIKSFVDNSRVKKFKIYLNGKPFCYLQLSDKMGLQYFDLPYIDIEGKNIYLDRPGFFQWTFEIIEVYPGRKWKDTAISLLYTDNEHLDF